MMIFPANHRRQGVRERARILSQRLFSRSRGCVASLAGGVWLLLCVSSVPAGGFDQEGERWWSLTPLQQPEVPRIAGPDGVWVRNPVDAFVLEKLREQGLKPSPEADRRTLARRLYYDLIGLPPTSTELDAFEADSNPKAYERLVEQLLNSPRYGERWARHWLDVVHYADTHGFDKDKLRLNAWPYRDYVIRAFNSDKPYDQFVSEQIAGDVIHPDSAEAVVATGFIAAGPWDFVAQAEVPETKIDGQVARHLDRDDMVATTLNTFVSMTAQCAQCHDHKFDPISQEDYYSLQAVFAAVDRADRPYDLDPEVAKRRRTFTARKRVLESRKSALESRIRELGGNELEAIEKSIGEARDKAKNSVLPEFGYHSAIEAVQDRAKWIQVDLGASVPVSRLVFVGSHDDFNNIGAGFGFPVRFKIEVSDDERFADAVQVVLDHTTADYANPGTDPQTVPLNEVRTRFIRFTATKLAPRQNDYIFSLGELSAFDANGKNLAQGAPVTAFDSIEAPPRWARANLVDGIHRGTRQEVDPEQLARLEEEKSGLLLRVVDPEINRELEAVKNELEGVTGRIAGLPKAGMVYAGTVHYGSGNFRGTGPDGGKPRVIRLLYRGSVLTPGPVVGPGTLAAIPELPSRFDLPEDAPEGERRRALADWITDRKNSLTWRSIVNRIWLYHFGRGLVDSPNDFGHMGQLPTHPRLLDWLAVEFRDTGRSIKNLHRLLVESAAYRQSSRSNPVMEGIDSENRYLWRMNRSRLDAEAIRDTVLVLSDALDEKMYGPGFQDFVIEKPEHSPHYQYHLYDPLDSQSHRRSIYRFLVRSQQQPFMTTLDCADPSMQVEKRTETYTALQALALMNDRFMLSMANRFADRLGREQTGMRDQVEAGFQFVTGRSAAEPEIEALVDYAEARGLPNLCRVLFNLNEFIFID